MIAPLLNSFFSLAAPSLKICGVTSADDALRLVDLAVPAVGINFYPKSKRYCAPEMAATFLPALSGQILRVGVFVNNASALAPQLLADGLIDVIQLHGDEGPAELAKLLATGTPTIRSLPLPAPSEEAATCARYRELYSGAAGPFALLLDAHAPGVYGGTGQTIDWARARDFISKAQELPVLLAGGITPENAAEALAKTHPAGIDIASGAESSPGIKDFSKIHSLLTATQKHPAR